MEPIPSHFQPGAASQQREIAAKAPRRPRSRHSRAIAAAALAAFAGFWRCGTAAAQDTTSTWTATTGTPNWTTAADWTNGVPSNNLFIAEFTGNVANSKLNAAETIDQLNFTGLTNALSITFGSSSDTLTLTASSTVNSVGLLLDSTSTAAATINAPIVLGSNQTWEIDAKTVNIGSAANGDGGFSGAFNLTKNGAGSLVINVPNNGYTGQTSILAGTLTLSANATYNGTLGLSSLPVLVGNTSGSSAATFTLAGTDNFSGNLTVQAGTTGTITLSGTGTTVLGNSSSLITLNQTATFDVGTSETNDVQGQITGVGGILKTSAGTLQLDNSNNNFSGTVDIRNGTIIVNGNTVLGTSTANVKLGDTSSGSATSPAAISLLTSGNYTVTNNLTDAAAAAHANTGSVTIGGTTGQTVGSTFSGNITLSTFASSASTVMQLQSYTSAGNAVTFSGALTGSGGLATAGTGTVAITAPAGTNTYAGPTNIASGTLQIGATNTLPTGTTVSLGSVLSNGTLDLNGNNQQIGGLAVAQSATAALQTITNNGSANSTLTYNGGTSSFGGTIQDGPTNTTALSITGGTLSLSGSNTYSGGTNIVSGTLQTGATNTLPTGATVTLGGASSNGTIDLAGNNQQIGGLAVAAGANAPTQIITNSGSTDATLTYNGATSTFGGTIQDGPTNKVALTINGGTFVLTGGNSYTGPTNVSAASLIINGSNTGGGSYNVSNSGTLGGTGSIATGSGASGLTVASNATLSPGLTSAGPAVGSLGITGDTNLNGALAINEAAGVFSAINVNGTLTIAPTSSLQISSADSFNGVTGSAYVIATYDTLNGNWGSSITGLPNGYTLDYDYSGNEIALVSSVPEPAGLGLGAFAVAGLLLARRRRVPGRGTASLT